MSEESGDVAQTETVSGGAHGLLRDSEAAFILYKFSARTKSSGSSMSIASRRDMGNILERVPVRFPSAALKAFREKR
jgi:hypothetical protein